MSSKKHLVKIKYDYDIMPEKEARHFIAAAIALIVMTVTIVTLIISAQNPSRVMTHDVTTTYYFPFFIFFSAIALIYALAIALPSFIGRMKSKQHRKIMVQKGKKVTGEIVSLKQTQINGNNEKNFTYTIEYEDPFEGKTTTVITPWTVGEVMLVKEKDLPIKVTVYIYHNIVLVDSLINPPAIKMYFRRNLKNIIAWIIVATMLICACVFGYSNPSAYAAVLLTCTLILLLMYGKISY